MKAARVLIFAPADQTGETHRKLEAEGCELRLGKASWDTPQGNSEPEMVLMAQECDALMGTSIRNTPISRTVMEASQSLRIVAKYTIGLGRIGSRIATLLRPWNMRILATDPYVPEARFAEHGVERVGLDTLLRESDVVSLHVVLTRETRHMIGPRELALMKSSAILIN